MQDQEPLSEGQGMLQIKIGKRCRLVVDEAAH